LWSRPPKRVCPVLKLTVKYEVAEPDILLWILYYAIVVKNTQQRHKTEFNIFPCVHFPVKIKSAFNRYFIH
jgi:hypothetical protein